MNARFLVFCALIVIAAAPVRAQEPGPGETSSVELAPLLVTGYDPATGELSLSYQSGCEASDNNIYYGSLEDVSAYAWSGAECGIGSSGVFEGFNPGVGSSFFIVAGSRGREEGSYGQWRAASGGSGKRPPFTANTCGDVQTLSNTCEDPPEGATCVSSLECGVRQDCVADAAGGGYCECKQAYEGQYCQQCAPGYTGPDCRECDEGYYAASLDETDVDGDGVPDPNELRCEPDVPGGCSGMSCSGNGSCVADGRNAVCVCEEGYSGADCSQCAPDFETDAFGDCVLGELCRSSKCGGHGACVETSFGEIACECDAGYNGVDCGGPELAIATTSERNSLYEGESLVLTPAGGFGPYGWRLLSGPAQLEDCLPGGTGGPEDGCPLGGARLTVVAGTGGIAELELIKVDVIDSMGNQASGNYAAVPPTVVPLTGDIRSELVPFYQAMLKYMRARGIRAGALAISKGGKLIGVNGYGYRDAGLDNDPFVNAGEGGPLVQPQSPFRLASLTKTLTAAAVRDAATQSGVNVALNDPFNRAVNWLQQSLGFPMAAGPVAFNYNLQNGQPDQRWNNISIQHLLNHDAGFYRDVVPAANGGLPAFNASLLPNTGLLPNQLQAAAWGANSSDLSYATTYILAALQLSNDPRITVDQVLRFVKGTQLNYTPGNVGGGDNYSNLGYIILGRVLEALRNQSFDPDEPGQPSGWGAYPALVQDYLCEASGITNGVYPGDAFNPWPGEPYYRDIDWQGNEVLGWNLAEGSDKIRFNQNTQRWQFCQANCGGGGAVWGEGLNTPAAYGGIWLAERNSAGGMVATAPALLRFARDHRIRVGAPGQTTTGIGTLLPSPGNHSWRSGHSGSLQGTSTHLWQLGGSRTNRMPLSVATWDEDPADALDLDDQGAVRIIEGTIANTCQLPGDVTLAVLFNQRQDRRAPSTNVSPESNQTRSGAYNRIFDFLGAAACEIELQGWPQQSQGGAVLNAPVVCP